LLVVPLWVQVFDVDSVEKNLAFIRIVEALNQRDNRRLSAPRRATQRNDSFLGVIDFEADLLKGLDFRSRGVLKAHISELNGASYLLKLLGFMAALGLNLGLRVDQLVQLIACAQNLREVSKLFGNLVHIHDHELQVEEKRCDFAHSDQFSFVQLLRHEDNDHHRAIHKCLRHQSEARLPAHFEVTVLVELSRSRIEFFTLGPFISKRLYNANVAENFLGLNREDSFYLGPL
jgi:hypothetical protein